MSVLAIRKTFVSVTVSFSSKYGYKLKESKAAVLPGVENNFRRRIDEALEILRRSSTLTRDRGFEVLTLPYKGTFWQVIWFTQAHVTDALSPYSRCDSVES